jgi:NitT/TauT family transport system substrate-binding protein
MRAITNILAAALILIAAARGAPAEPYHLRIGWVVTPADLATLMFLKPELAPHAGKSYIPELIHFAGTPAEMTALATGELDTAALAYSTFALGIQNAGMEDLRIIGDEFQDGVPGYHTNPFVVRKDSPIQTVDDLKGKSLATNQAGSAIDMALRAMLARHHLADKKDVTIIEVRFPDMKAMLNEKKVDLISAVAPFGFDPELQGFSRTLFTQEQAMGRSQMIVRAARAGFIEKHRAVMVDFMEDYVHALHWLSDPAHHAEVVALIVQATKQKPDRFESWIFTKQDYYRDPDAIPDLAALQQNVDLQHKLGFLRKPVVVEKYADLSIVKEAAARLKH